MSQLYRTLDERRRPEDVAEMLLEEVGATLKPDEFKLLNKAAAHSLKRSFSNFTSMMENFQLFRIVVLYLIFLSQAPFN